MHPESYSLELVNWSLFVTLTLPNDLVSASERRLGSVVFAWLRRVAAFSGVHFHDLKWAVRSELGETTGRLHFHLLVGGIPEPRCSKRYCFMYKNEWERITGAMSRVHRYNDGLPGVGYVLKGGTAYEAGKFARSADQVTLSRSILRATAQCLRHV